MNCFPLTASVVYAVYCGHLEEEFENVAAMMFGFYKIELAYFYELSNVQTKLVDDVKKQLHFI